MELFGAIGGGLFVLASLVVGGRILWRARIGRELPEIALGGGLFLMGGLGYPLMVAAAQATDLSDELRSAFALGHMLANITGMSGMAWFTGHVFRPDAVWAKALLASLSLGYVGLAAGQIFGAGLLAFANDPEHGVWHWQLCVGVAVMLWAGTEPLLYWRMQRRRLAIGLADPVVCDRFLLWSVSILCAAVLSIVSIVLSALGIPTTGTTIGSLLVGGLGLVTATLLSLAFMPPKRYTAWIQARAAVAG